MKNKARLILNLVARFLARRWVLLSPKDPLLFSERYGYRRPVLKLRGWRIVPSVEIGSRDMVQLTIYLNGRIRKTVAIIALIIALAAIIIHLWRG